MNTSSPRRVYMDYQASTPVDPRVAEILMSHLLDYPGNPHAEDHAAGWEAAAAVERSTRTIASTIGADSNEIIFTSGATEANNLAILGTAARAPAGRRRILVSATEHKCVLEAARTASLRFGTVVEPLPVDRIGVVRLDVLQERLADDVLLVSVMSVNNEIGTVQPIEEIARMCRRVGALLHSDAAHALTAAAPIDVAQLDVDLLSFSGHKLYAPKGIGALYVRREVQEQIEPLIYGGGQQGGLRSGTVPLPLCAALAEAVALLARDEASEERARVRDLRDYFIDSVSRLAPDTRLNGPRGAARHPGNANLSFAGFDARDLIQALQPAVAASTGSACTSGMPEPSHVLRAIGLSESEAASSIRFSIGRFTTQDDILYALDAIGHVLRERI